jgi:hypothetical protein
MRTACLIGTRDHGGGDTVTVRVSTGGHPDQMLPTLRAIWRWMFDGDTTAFTERLLRHHWVNLDPHASAAAGADVEPGVGTRDTTDHTAIDLHHGIAGPTPGDTEWLYVTDVVDDQIQVYRATGHGTWSKYGRHRLHADLDGTFSSPLPRLGDAATADQVGHHWRSATVSVDGLHTAWTAEICTGEHARGVIVVRFDHDTLADAIDTLHTFYADRLPGSGLPHHDLNGDLLVTTWYPGTPHAQSQSTYADARGRFILGPHVWPWIVTYENPPTTTGVLRNGVPPIHEWVSPDGFFACHPHLADYPLAQVCAAITDLAGTRGVAVIARASNRGHVWLVAPSHALMITPAAWDTTAGAVLLPRPLGGSWACDQPVPTFTEAQVAAACAKRTAAGRQYR